MLVEEFEGQFACSGKNTEQNIMFSVPIEKEVTRNDKKGKEITKNISYRLSIIDSGRFKASSLSNPVNNLAEVIHKNKCKYGCDYNKFETCLCCYENNQKTFDENVKKRFLNT